MSRGVPSICACRQSSDKAARFDIKPLAASVFLHGAVVAALSVAISAGLLYSRGDALTDALEVELVLMPDVVPAVIEQKESLSGPHAKKAEEPPEIFSEADAVQTEPVSSRNAAQQAQPTGTRRRAESCLTRIASVLCVILKDTNIIRRWRGGGGWKGRRSSRFR